MKWFKRVAITTAALVGLAVSPVWGSGQILNVSYDPTRELYKEFNAAFAKHWKATTGEEIEIKASHGGACRVAVSEGRRFVFSAS